MEASSLASVALPLPYHLPKWLPCNFFHVSFSRRELTDLSRDPIVGAQYRWSANFAPAAPRFWGLIQGTFDLQAYDM